MRFDTRALGCVVFVGSAYRESFTPIGTAFAVASRVNGMLFQTLVTCRHVIEMISGKTVYIRANLAGGGVRVLDVAKSDWHFHPDENVDLAACPTVLRTDQFAILHLELESNMFLSEASIQAEEIGVGDEVSVVGLYTSHTGENRNLPIVRAGAIASMPREKISTAETGQQFHAYLVETRSIGGLSGSPVFVQLPMLRVVASVVKPPVQPIYFMGVLMGHHSTLTSVDDLGVAYSKAPKKRPRTVKVTQNTGIGVVIPAVEVNILINQPKIVEARMALKAKGATQFVPDAAPKSEEPERPPIEGDERHKERFTGLLDEALGKPKQDG